jgi:hypothetical protein
MDEITDVQSTNFSSLRDQLTYSNHLDFKDLRNNLDRIYSYLAFSFNLVDSTGKPRKSIIIDTLAKRSCLSCIYRTLSSINHSDIDNVDAIYKESHELAVNIMVEELYALLNKMGYKFIITTEVELNYGRADVLITITNYGLNLKSRTKELLVEVKTGNSLSFSQLFRYFLDGKSDTIIVWRIRKRQVLVFDAQKFKPLIAEFMRMICLRAIRLLSSQHQIPPCQHAKSPNYQPTQAELEKALEDFSEALVETLPAVLQTILKQLEDITPRESTTTNG